MSQNLKWQRDGGGEVLRYTAAVGRVEVVVFKRGKGGTPWWAFCDPFVLPPRPLRGMSLEGACKEALGLLKYELELARRSLPSDIEMMEPL